VSVLKVVCVCEISLNVDVGVIVCVIEADATSGVLGEECVAVSVGN
jgi:hypothetical protein